MWKYNQTPEPDELMHYGILGMKWGVRRSEAQLARARKKAAKHEPEHEDYTRAHDGKNVKYLSNDELKNRNKRLNAEKQYKDLTAKTSPVDKVLKSLTYTTAAIGTITAAQKAFEKAAPLVGKAMDKVGDIVVKDIKITSIH